MLETSKFKIGLCQLSVTSDKKTNLEKARSSIEFGSRQGASLVVLPEMWNCPCSTDVFAQFAEDFDDKDSALSFKMLSEVACKEGITIVGGSIPEWCGGELYNTCCVFAPNGELLAKHRKLHLFDVDIPGDVSFHESNTFSAGDWPTIVDTDVGRIGIGICHDIRFPELAMVYKARGAHLICYPGAFNVSTGEALWEIEQRARAVDNQLFVATCSPSRDSAGSYAIWGHSSLVSPVPESEKKNHSICSIDERVCEANVLVTLIFDQLGEVVATSGHDETIVVAEVDCSQVRITRESLPILKQRRESVYQLIDLND